MKKVALFVVILEIFISCLALQDCGTSKWAQINDAAVCFKGKGNNPGTFRAVHPGFAAAIKLVHRSGFIRCSSNDAHKSHFGCHLLSRLKENPLNVVVTNSKNQTKFPTREGSILKPTKAYWYGLDGVDSMSKEIVLQHGFNHPYYIYQNQTLRVWYGEDLTNEWEGDNVGQVCVDVLAHFI